MKTKITFLLFVLLGLSDIVSGLTTSITFRSNSDISVRINKPIDGMFNFYVFSDILDLKPNISINYELKLHDFGSLRCEYSNGNFFRLLVQEGDHLEIDNTNDQIVFKGDNAAGNQYLVDNYCKKGLGFYYPRIESIFKKNITERIDFNGIDRAFRDSIIPSYSIDIDMMKKEGKITARFANLMSNNLYFAYTNILLKFYEALYKGRFHNYKPSVADSVQIIKKMDELFSQNVTIENPLKYYFYPKEYYSFKYKTLDAATKAKLIGKYDSDTFGAFSNFLLAPDSLQSILFGESFVSELKNMYNSFDHDKMLKYLTDKFPESEYVSIIKNMMITKKKSVGKANNLKSIFLEGKAIHTLKELSQVNAIKGKRLYIDLWSISCMPCKVQFQYSENLHKLLNRYDNLVSVYINTDEVKQDAIWRTQVEHYHLIGYNLRASKALFNDIQRIVYKKGAFTLPRYILLDAEGNILNDNLPRPQALDKLKIVLDEKLTVK